MTAGLEASVETPGVPASRRNDDRLWRGTEGDAEMTNSGRATPRPDPAPRHDSRIDEDIVERPQRATAADHDDALQSEAGRKGERGAPEGPAGSGQRSQESWDGNGPHPDVSLNGERPSRAAAESASGELASSLVDGYELLPDIELLPGGEALTDIGETNEGVPKAAFRRARGRATQTQPDDLSSTLPHGPSPLKALMPIEEWTSEERPASPRAAVPKQVRARPEWCTIVLAHTNNRTGEFQVITTDGDGLRRVTGRSSRFRVPRSRRPNKRAAARVAHDALVEGLLASGWRPLEARGRWHDTAFIRYPEKS
jgi:hypothetical protein